MNLDEEYKEFSSIRSSTIYTRSTLMVANLEDFLIRKVIGKGAFGKVYLVENKKDSSQNFAMKSI